MRNTKTTESFNNLQINEYLEFQEVSFGIGR
jgi:hypothetical protein